MHTGYEMFGGPSSLPTPVPIHVTMPILQFVRYEQLIAALGSNKILTKSLYITVSR